jgi:hypothetical protein
MTLNVLRASTGVAFFLCGTVTSLADDGAQRTIPRTSIRSIQADMDVAASADSGKMAEPLTEPFDARQLQRSGNVAGVPGTPVYLNETAAPPGAYRPGVGDRLADDLTLANGAGEVVYYSVGVYNFASSGTYTADVELWTGNPCMAGSTVIPDSHATFTNIPAVHPDGGHASILEATLDPPIAVPATVWIAVTFSGQRGSNAGWLVACKSEVGSTQNFLSENDTVPNPDVCDLYSFIGGSPWAGFWAQINADVSQPPAGACCSATSCAQTTEADCSGVWQGAFTACQPNPCLAGGCCTGVDFQTCNDNSEATCNEGCGASLFHPGTSCAESACGAFIVYANNFHTGIFVPIDTDEMWGDDLKLGAGAPCNLEVYEVHVAGEGPPATFDARVELWTNNTRGTTPEEDDTPLAAIAGTGRDFTGLAADGTRKILRGGPFTGVPLPDKIWMVLTTSTDTSGPIFAGMATVGLSRDAFARFNEPATPNAWSLNWNFEPNGFDPTGCPGGADCVPAGSFRATIWCEGNAPTGACCNDVAGTCSEDVLQADCEGRWIEDETCATAPFNPPCGTHACCYPNSITCPGPFCSILCDDKTPADCTAAEGSSSPGRFCVNMSCPGLACINRPGSCYTSHGTGGCDNASCCEKVCAVDPLCCSQDWDVSCTNRARMLCSSDQCDEALPIAGAGTFRFDNTDATTDGPMHQACASIGDDQQIAQDVWYCWTSPCTQTVFVRTCGQTELDTKLAVYDGCECPPTGENLLDCGDDRCGEEALQSTAVFQAGANRNYLIRLGSYPNIRPPAPQTGTGTMTISCGPPGQVACPTTAAQDCCNTAGFSTPACDNETCCERVCGCDQFCCTTEWDAGCAANGYQGSGCGAKTLCPTLCGTCPSGTVEFVDPPSGVVDARRTHTAQSVTPRLGIDSLVVNAPEGSDNPKCWSLCETATTGTANGVVGVSENGDGRLTVHLARPITPGAITKVTHLGSGAVGTLTFHPGNVNGLGQANSTDISDFALALGGVSAIDREFYSMDIDYSGMITPADLLEAIALLIGEGLYDVWNGSPLPQPNANCP